MEVFVFMPTYARHNQLKRICAERSLPRQWSHQRLRQIVREGTDKLGWFDMSTLKERTVSRQKTMGLEIARQRGWQLPRHSLSTGRDRTHRQGSVSRLLDSVAQVGQAAKARQLPNRWLCADRAGV